MFYKNTGVEFCHFYKSKLGTTTHFEFCIAASSIIDAYGLLFLFGVRPYDTLCPASVRHTSVYPSHFVRRLSVRHTLSGFRPTVTLCLASIRTSHFVRRLSVFNTMFGVYPSVVLCLAYYCQSNYMLRGTDHFSYNNVFVLLQMLLC